MTSHFYLAEHSLRIGKSATRPWEAQASKQLIRNTNPLMWRGHTIQNLRKCQILTCRQTVHVFQTFGYDRVERKSYSEEIPKIGKTYYYPKSNLSPIFDGNYRLSPDNQIHAVIRLFIGLLPRVAG